MLMLAGIGTVIAAMTSFFLWNPIGLSVVGVITGLIIIIFPNVPWFLPPIIVWLLVFTAIAVMITVTLRKSGTRLV
ncbi:MAG: hypothetical protein UY31_C0075G0002 [Candidatus Wolfebacteria bacterium GW2011_GWE1_48_7]|nr:MAG: hypothetical protein UX83_C0004G0003 [Candidatus Wolfebacteria bacterium GW2011_GWE2_47_12]KKU90078.1 MAG: hypothetical protein UY19_C0006G0016 [Candidatus Wolfebacteria bacterium GW2011_GWA2_47_9b]KKU97448.1 MAG: hypothetical protein UY31_C0075G0002 [Candidatus Wolfebacteria bacterium GW2011_GWE1_48_7]